MFGDLSSLMAQPMGLSFSSPQIAGSLGGPGIGQMASSMPSFSPSFSQMIGGALRGTAETNQGTYPMQPQQQGLMPPHASGLLQAILSDPGPPMQGGGLAAILQRLGALR